MFKRIALLSITFLMITTSFFTNHSWALEPPPNDLTIGTGSTANDYQILASQYFMSGQSTIQALSSTKVRVSADTRAYRPVDRISVDMYLERWDSGKGQWVNVLFIGSATNYYSFFVSSTKDVNVLKDSYYRTKVIHHLVQAGISEQKTSISSYVYTK
ncbi:DUF6147 family protein [Bacillus sp. FJAT-50079]|uniref:DUF6147 family protein n=1 Tax=Bacillus sp. FJAT-50079 TaxID=2833577 RepID=UPI001BC95D37|nr:DUF6147 family protein [Bacillus sp. FJAT-50079]MBS4208916.1 hypothetical protein [Bacillus sp. FJAT-50079]